jgi:hypothetical protein
MAPPVVLATLMLFADCPAQAADDSRMRSAGSRALLLKG